MVLSLGYVVLVPWKAPHTIHQVSSLNLILMLPLMLSDLPLVIESPRLLFILSLLPLCFVHRQLCSLFWSCWCKHQTECQCISITFAHPYWLRFGAVISPLLFFGSNHNSAPYFAPVVMTLHIDYMYTFIYSTIHIIYMIITRILLLYKYDYCLSVKLVRVYLAPVFMTGRGPGHLPEAHPVPSARGGVTPQRARRRGGPLPRPPDRPLRCAGSRVRGPGLFIESQTGALSGFRGFGVGDSGFKAFPYVEGSSILVQSI